MTMGLMDFLRSAADDPRAQGIAVNPGSAGAPFAAILEDDGVERLIASLKRRGFAESPARTAPGESAEILAITTAPAPTPR